jgi:hypothetical protein
MTFNVRRHLNMARRQRVRTDSSYKQASLLSFYPASKHRLTQVDSVIRKRVKVCETQDERGVW